MTNPKQTPDMPGPTPAEVEAVAREIVMTLDCPPYYFLDNGQPPRIIVEAARAAIRVLDEVRRGAQK